MDIAEIQKLLHEAISIHPVQPSENVKTALNQTVTLDTDGAVSVMDFDREALPYRSLADTIYYKGVPYYRYKSLNEGVGNVIHPMRTGRFLLKNSVGTTGEEIASGFLSLATALPNGGLAWYYPQHYNVARMMGEGFKYSAISQGTIISAYIEAGRKIDKRFEDTAKRAYKAMEFPFQNGGVDLHGKVVLEMPSFAGPPEIILNGWLDALFHIRDYSQEMADDSAKQKFRNNVEFLVQVLDNFDDPEHKLSRYSDVSPYRILLKTGQKYNLSDLQALYVPKHSGMDPVSVPLNEVAASSKTSPYENHIHRRNGRKSFLWISMSQLYDTYIIAQCPEMEIEFSTGSYSPDQSMPGYQGRTAYCKSVQISDTHWASKISDDKGIIKGYPTNFMNAGGFNFYHAYHVVALFLIGVGDFVQAAERRTILECAFKWMGYCDNPKRFGDVQFTDFQEILGKLNHNLIKIQYENFDELVQDARSYIS